MSNSFKLCPPHFSMERRKIFQGGLRHLAPPWLRACVAHDEIQTRRHLLRNTQISQHLQFSILIWRSISIISDPQNLPLRCIVNGEVMQESSTNQLVFGIKTCVSWISKICTLKPGDLLLTGTPPGVGVFRNPPIFLKV